MGAANRALCFFYRHPPEDSGVKPLPFSRIRLRVVKADGSAPSEEACRNCVRDFHNVKGKRGRKHGWRKTSRAQDNTILCAFRRLRPPGAGVESRDVANALPKTLQGKVCLRTIRNRLKEKGYTPTKKSSKAEASTRTRCARMAFCRLHAKRTGPQWVRYLQGVADFKQYTYFPKTMQMRWSRYMSSWTYMTKAERLKPAFVRPKRMFTKKEYAHTIKGKVFGLTLSNGQKLLSHVPKNLTSADFAKLVRRRIGPFFRDAFPGRRACLILLDGEPLMHTDIAKEALREWVLHALSPWPAYSPDLNPQENVWPWLEKALRKEECYGDTFSTFRARLTRLAAKYPHAERLVASMPERIAVCLKRRGAMTGH